MAYRMLRVKVKKNFLSEKVDFFISIKQDNVFFNYYPYVKKTQCVPIINFNYELQPFIKS